MKNCNRLGLLKDKIILADNFDEWSEDIAVKFGIKGVCHIVCVSCKRI